MDATGYVDPSAVSSTDGDVSISMPADASLSRLRRTLLQLALGAAPVILWLVLGGPAVSPMNGIDEYIYIGAVERLRDFLLRWPDTYYAARFGYLIPEWTAERLFGPTLGYFVVRFSLLGVVALGCSLRGRIKPWPAAFGVVVLMSPIVVSAAFNTYTLSFAVLFLMCGATLLSGAPTGGVPALATALIAGAALSMSWNAHLTALPVCMAVALVFSIDTAIEFRANLRSALLSAGSVALGAIIVVSGGVAIYRWRLGVSDLYGPSLRQAQQDTNTIFMDRGFSWLTWRPYLLLGPLSMCAGVVVWRTTHEVVTRRAVRRLVLFSASAWAVFAYFQWMRRDPLLAIFYYSSLPLALSLLTLARSASIVAGRLRPRIQKLSMMGSTIAIVVVWLWFDTVKTGFWVVLSVSLVVIITTAIAFRLDKHVFLALTLLIAVASWATVVIPHTFPGASVQFRVDPFYDRLFFHYDYDGLHRIDVAREFAQLMPVLPTSRGEIRIWFDSSGSMNQVLSTMVHYRSALQSPGAPAMPQYDSFLVDRLTQDRPRYVAILDSDLHDVDRGIKALQGLAPYRVVWQKNLASGSYVASVALLERSDGLWRDFPCPGPENQALACP